ncbi:MaoC family dehydratase N-terminal domain-containing protein [uncultured Cohaesibacter sp.]|uniref:FAS1-like dehydratase domain-containing protein n=1 Tax=uncultured Cohaesibacter sp. TaxID=1002546 RepID=UPI0029C93B7B|nr:MaoC family dehydratase N-terminal domain-containing protein [uncultured Cohaesibacter sp.]
MTLDIDHLRGWIGSEDHASELLTLTLLERLNATLDRGAGMTPDLPVPLLTHHCLCQPVAPTASLGTDGHPARGGFLPPVPLPRRMWAGGEIEFHAPMVAGDIITRHSVVEDVVVKEGRSGTLCFVTVRHRYSNIETDCITERQDIVYREAAAPGALAATPTQAEQGEMSKSVPMSPVLLFRYSALTFNGHRIHYDHPYVTAEEGYPGLVVHGPMQAMLLALYAEECRGTAPAIFRYRGLSPVFADTPLILHAKETETGLKLWSAAPDGPVAMEAEAEWQ